MNVLQKSNWSIGIDGIRRRKLQQIDPQFIWVSYFDEDVRLGYVHPECASYSKIIAQTKEFCDRLSINNAEVNKSIRLMIEYLQCQYGNNAVSQPLTIFRESLWLLQNIGYDILKIHNIFNFKSFEPFAIAVIEKQMDVKKSEFVKALPETLILRRMSRSIELADALFAAHVCVNFGRNIEDEGELLSHVHINARYHNIEQELCDVIKRCANYKDCIDAIKDHMIKYPTFTTIYMIRQIIPGYNPFLDAETP
jgi:hypothetical protein